VEGCTTHPAAVFSFERSGCSTHAVKVFNLMRHMQAIQYLLISSLTFLQFLLLGMCKFDYSKGKYNTDILFLIMNHKQHDDYITQ